MAGILGDERRQYGIRGPRRIQHAQLMGFDAVWPKARSDRDKAAIVEPLQRVAIPMKLRPNGRGIRLDRVQSADAGDRHWKSFQYSML